MALMGCMTTFWDHHGQITRWRDVACSATGSANATSFGASPSVGNALLARKVATGGGQAGGRAVGYGSRSATAIGAAGRASGATSHRRRGTARYDSRRVKPLAARLSESLPKLLESVLEEPTIRPVFRSLRKREHCSVDSLDVRQQVAVALLL